MKKISNHNTNAGKCYKETTTDNALGIRNNETATRR
jgi:hypothetical protein